MALDHTPIFNKIILFYEYITLNDKFVCNLMLGYPYFYTNVCDANIFIVMTRYTRRSAQMNRKSD